MTLQERKNKLQDILKQLQISGYIYDKSKGGVHGIQRPPAGTRLNCESAARIFMQLAINSGIDNLQAVYYKNEGNDFGYFVPANRTKALGCEPEINTQAVKGWELDNHWRVKDPSTGCIYDPTFGTRDDDNPHGFLGSSMQTNPALLTMTTVYGEKYRIARDRNNVDCTELTHHYPDVKYWIVNTDFTVKLMSKLVRPAASPAT